MKNIMDKLTALCKRRGFIFPSSDIYGGINACWDYGPLGTRLKNNIKTEWYWGLMKGAEETLRQKSGNDADQAALLVAMLRSAGFPARFVQGTIEFFPNLEVARNITGINDAQDLLVFFQNLL